MLPLSWPLTMKKLSQIKNNGKSTKHNPFAVACIYQIKNNGKSIKHNPFDIACIYQKRKANQYQKFPCSTMRMAAAVLTPLERGEA